MTPSPKDHRIRYTTPEDLTLELRTTCVLKYLQIGYGWVKRLESAS
jgi:hypothetical protein